MKVMVSGCFDLLHSGHVAFLQAAARYGQVYVCIGSDENILHLKKRRPVNPQEERKYMLEALSCVHEVRINQGMGILDFVSEMLDIQPDVFFVNEDGHSTDKEQLCRERGVQYIVSNRIPEGDLPVRSTTALRSGSRMPYRIDLAGGWLDQPWVSSLHPGPVLTIGIEATHDFNLRSGMSTSTRNKAIELWPLGLPNTDLEKTAKMLFAYENPPGTKEIAGSQDSIGIVFPGLNCLHYAGKYWPERIESIQDESILAWLERYLWLVPLQPRTAEYSVLDNTQLSTQGAAKLAMAASDAWHALLKKDLNGFAAGVRASFEAQIAMFPNMADAAIFHYIDQYRSQAKAWKLSGAGGGGYLILVAEGPISGALQIQIRKG
jgi:cytidyltransferase-like protein